MHTKQQHTLPLCSYTPTIPAKLPPSFSFAPPQPHRPFDPYIKFSTVVAEFASTPLAMFNNAQHATSTTLTRPKLVFGPTFATMPSLLRMCRRRCTLPSKIVFLVFPRAGYVNSRYAPTRLLILKTLPGPPASTLTWRRRRVAPTLWSLFKLPRASDTFKIANVGVAPPLEVLSEFWGSRKQLLLVAPLFSALHHYFSTPASSPLPSPQRRQVKFDISPSGEQGSNPTPYLQLKIRFFAFPRAGLRVQRQFFQYFCVQLHRRVRYNNAMPSQTRRNLNYTIASSILQAILLKLSQ
ncbi:hypothetical protein C8R43DRAFT_950736 [Mycena crocata]|nr:hypothetical protein C8R43DRAFT_950736 [Mycena crocata]